MGWLALIAIRPLWLHVPVAGWLWLLAGGLAYTAGIAFYAAERVRYGHLVWHVFVLMGTACHFCAVLWYAGLTSFLEFIRLVVDGDIDEVSRRLAASPALAAAASEVGATRHEASTFFFADIAHYLYAGDTALHMAAAAFRRPVAELLVAHGADCRAKNRRGAEPLHYAADANRWDPTAQAETIEYLLSVGADPNAVDTTAWRRCTERCERGRWPQYARCWMAARTPAAEQGGVDAAAPGRSDDRARGKRFSARA